jgi:hypothetical protein
MGNLNINTEQISEYQKNKNRNQNSYQYNQAPVKENVMQGFDNLPQNKLQQQKSYKDYLDSQVKEKSSMKSNNFEKPVQVQNQPIIGDSRPARFLKKSEILSSNPCKKI